MEIRVDKTKKLGAMKPVNGLCNGPVSYGGLVDMSEDYRTLQTPYVRLHDTDWPFPQQVDVFQIFRDFTRDPDDPANYDFVLTDQYISAIVGCGAKIVYRLGTSIEHLPKKRWVIPPDPETFARVCVGIIRHFNEGWADGYHYDIRYWEIWNEPEDFEGQRIQMWTGTAEEYYRLYDVTAKKLRQVFGDAIRIGGYASCGFYGIFQEDPKKDLLLKFYDGFLAYISAHKSPLDFFSYHYYGNEIERHPAMAEYAKRTLAEAGYPDAELVLDEWNMHFGGPETYEKMRRMEGARHAVKTMITYQNTCVDIAAYYDAQPHMWWCGLWNRDLVRQKTWYGFYLYGLLRALGTQVEATADEKLTVLAAGNEKKTGLLIVGTEETEHVTISGLGEKATVYTLREGSDFGAAMGSGEHVTIPAGAILYLETESE